MVRIKHITILGFLIILEILVLSTASAADYKPKDYVWTTQSQNSSESMPCGGHDIGMNVWVEDGDVLFYVSQSGWFDENNTLLKAGRWRIHFDDQLSISMTSWSQEPLNSASASTTGLSISHWAT